MSSCSSSSAVWLSLSIVIAGSVGAASSRAQERASDRRRFMSADTTTTDDPRRTPVDPTVPRGPTGAIVLRGGLIFDGTGTPAHAGTLVLKRNAIGAVLAADSSAWPGDARVIDATGMTVMPGLIDLHTHLTDGQIASIPVTLLNDPADGVLRAVERLRFY